ncbi:hypothetical protein [Pelagibacterium halotolerans]|uniref:hypothetical protein n=1 Tax=Pelagibacterium halotolerans TaxID=531813 RepID=UPI00384BE816
MSKPSNQYGEGAQSGERPARWNVRETRLRLPRAVVQELKRVADARDMTMNALVATYIDAGLKADGRRGVHELADWFADYLRRKGGSGGASHSVGSDEDFT